MKGLHRKQPCRCILLLLLLLCSSNSIKGQHVKEWPAGQRIIDFYKRKGDSLKLKAAEFLVTNIPYHWSVKSNKLDQYYAGIANINEKYAYPACISEFDTLYSKLGNVEDTIMVNDRDAVSEKTIINHIELAFHDWRNGAWARHLSFNDFCEYLLPYRIGNEKYEDWRIILRNEFLPFTDDIKYSEDMRPQSYWAAYTIATELKRRRFRDMKMLPQLGVEYPVSALRHIKMGECSDYGKITTYIMRACGIPVSLDFTPQWPDRALNHHWNALYDNSGRIVPFMGYEAQPGYPCKEGWRRAKVYRYTFGYQSESLHAQNSRIGQRIPEILNSPFYKDVTMQYFRTFPLEVHLNNAHARDSFAYVAVFDNQQWVPVDFARIDSGNIASFKNLGGEIAYLPAYWGRNGCIPASDIVVLGVDGKTHLMKHDKKKTRTLTLKRKYPMFNRIAGFWKGLVGGRIEAANNSDFSDAVTCATIGKATFLGYDTLLLSHQECKYRYWRYVSPEKGRCNIAELSFLNNKNVIQPQKAISSDNASAAMNVLDGKRLSYFESRKATGWVGADMGQDISVTHVAILPRNDDNEVVPGHIYELCYFDGGKQISLGKQVATGHSVTYDNVPSNAVLILHDLSEGTEERIFVYENNIITWY